MKPHDPSLGPDKTADYVPPASIAADTVDATRREHPTDATAPRSRVADDRPAPEIPGYRITAQIARGGMGRVYAAIDLSLDREVAVKTLLPGADGERFVIESKITARLPHPGIPPVHALGTLADGSHYLAMKRIRGQTLAELLDARSSPQDDLPRFVRIFEQIAQAVGFAHSRGVIHRDLKPLNVMVGEFGEVQVMDWGLAKELGQLGRDAVQGGIVADVEFTQAGTIMGTPGYMAPEQARGEELDTRADVFALGSVLAAILTGRPAFVGTTARTTIERAAMADLDDVRTRLRRCQADEELIALATRCLAVDRADRPGDAEAVAVGVAHYRAGVEARLRQAETERAEAIVREAEHRKRRRVMLGSAAVVVAVLLAGLGVSLWQMNRAIEAEAATAGQLVETRKARADAEKKLGFSKRSNEILGSVFDGLDPHADYATVAELRDALRANLEKAIEQLDDGSIGDPLTVAEMQSQIARSLLGLGEAELALALLEQVRATRAAELGSEHRGTLATMNNIAGAYHDAGRLDQALPLYEETLRLRTERLGPDDPDTLMSMNNLATGYHEAGRRDQALALFEETLRLRKARLGPDHPDTLMSMNNLAAGYDAAGKLDEALRLSEETFELRRAKLGTDHPQTLTSMNNLAQSYKAAGKLDRALPLWEQTLTRMKARLGPDHPDTLTCMGNLAQSYKAIGKLDQALPLLEETLRLTTAQLGPEHPATLTSANSLALGYHDAGKLDQALPLYEETLRMRKDRLGPEHPDTLSSMNNLAGGYQAAGKLHQALPLFEETLRIRKDRLGPEHPQTLISMNNVAECFRLLGELDQALPLWQEALRIQTDRLGPDHPDTLMSMNNLATGYKATGKLDLALPLLEETLSLRKARLGPEHPDTLMSMNNLAKGYEADGKLERALPLFEETLTLTKARLGPDHPQTLVTLYNLAGAYQGAGKPDQALPMFEETFRLRTDKLGPDHSDTLKNMNNLGTCYWSLGRLDKSVPLFEELMELQLGKFGRGHPDTQIAIANLGINYKDAGRLPEAIPLLEEAHRSATRFPSVRWVAPQLLDGYVKAGQKAEAARLVTEMIADAREALPDGSLQLAAQLAEFGFLLLELGAFAESEPLLGECLAIRAKHEPDYWATFNTMSMLGGALLGLQKYAEAEPLLVQGYEGMSDRAQELPAGAAVRLVEALDRLIKLYTATNQPDALQKYQELRDRSPDP